MAETIAIIGLGEVGTPLLELVRQSGLDAVGVDVAPVDLPARGTASVMHVCYPFEVDDFVGETVRYFDLLRPALTVIESTVAVGTTRAVHERTGSPVVHSPIRGKHARMLSELTHYDKSTTGSGSFPPIPAASFVAASEHCGKSASRPSLK